MIGKTKLSSEQEILDKVKSVCFRESLTPFACQLACSDTYQYGFRYNAGQEPPLENEYEDYEPLALLLKTAKNNDINTGETNFPDFVCDNGLIEHFKVFASEEDDNKGSAFKIMQSIINKEVFKEIKNDCKNGTMKKFYQKETKVPIQSYDLFIKSFKRNWNKHRKHLIEYNEENKHKKVKVCFLIENVSSGLRMNIRQRDEYELGIETGKLIENRENKNENFNRIMVGRCKELLQFIYQDRELIDYVIVYSADNCIEIIKTDRADYISNLLPEYDYQEALTFQTCTATTLGGRTREN